ERTRRPRARRRRARRSQARAPSWTKKPEPRTVSCARDDRRALPLATQRPPAALHHPRDPRPPFPPPGRRRGVGHPDEIARNRGGAAAAALETEASRAGLANAA